jgi:RecA/RadA recombinase
MCAKVKKEDNKEEKVDQIESLLQAKEFQGLHLGSRSGNEIEKPEIISTSSFFFDQILGGGFRAGSWIRAKSEPEMGKTSQGLCWGRNWQNHFKERAVVVVFNAEGRVTRDLLVRSGLDISKERFRIIDTNNADFIYNMMERLIVDNKDDLVYYFIVDSTDAAQRSQDMLKSLGEAEKIGGSATIASAAGKRLSLLFNRKQHVLYMTSQVRDKVNTYSPQGNAGKEASGGNAPRFYSSLTMEIKKHWSDWSIREEPSDAKSKEIGRLVNIKLEKTYNESSGSIVQVPVKYGHIGGIWHEYEAMLICQAWNLYINSGKGRFNIDPKFAQELSEQKISFEESFHGEKNMRAAFEINPQLVEYVYDKMRKIAISYPY